MPDYYELHEVSTVLRGTDTDMRLELMLEQGSADSQAEKERVLLSLLSTQHFTEARKFAELVNLSGDHITRKEVRRAIKHPFHTSKFSLTRDIGNFYLLVWINNKFNLTIFP